MPHDDKESKMAEDSPGSSSSSSSSCEAAVSPQDSTAGLPGPSAGEAVGNDQLQDLSNVDDIVVLSNGTEDNTGKSSSFSN